ncbi:MAG: transposase, partial [Ktedonobacteraceae bacterium]|nr:transposase [Ktedonobacteraceae bacterium]
KSSDIHLPKEGGTHAKDLFARLQARSRAPRADQWQADCPVARELGISDTSIHQWRKELAAHGQDAFPGSGHQTPLEEENRRLKRELERVQRERDILKKALVIFSQPQP